MLLRGLMVTDQPLEGSLFLECPPHGHGYKCILASESTQKVTPNIYLSGTYLCTKCCLGAA